MVQNTTTSITPAEVEKQTKERTRKEKVLDLIKAYARSPEVLTRFSNLLGDRPGRRYIESVIIAVQENENLLECSPKSIMIAAMRAASLQLSVDPSLRQAHLVVYKDHGKPEVKFIPDYHGLVQLSTGTGMYIDPPNVTEVYEGEEVSVDRFSGRVTITGSPTQPATIQGWVAYYKDINNCERFLYMSNEECDAHGKKYNPGGFSSSKTPWATDRDKMRCKTCLRVFLIQWGYFSPMVKNVIFQEEDENQDDGSILDGQFMDDMPEVSDVTLQVRQKQSENGNMSDLGYNPDEVTDKTWNDWRNLVVRAEMVKIPVADVDRSHTTEKDLKLAYDELQRFVLDAEDQASVA